MKHSATQLWEECKIERCETNKIKEREETTMEEKAIQYTIAEKISSETEIRTPNHS